MAASRVPKDDLAALLGGKSSGQPTCGRLDVALDDLRVDVAGVGVLGPRLTPAMAQKLVAVSSPAPFGRGQDTLLDPAVRNTSQVPTGLVQVDWGHQLQPALEEARAVLGLPEGTVLTAQLHSLLVYEKGQFFLPHQDSEKHDAMVASLVVTLPSRHTGGELVIHDGSRALTFRASPTEPDAVVFYADQVHEVVPVRSGHRVSVTFNITVSHVPDAGVDDDDVEPVVRLLHRHFTTRPRPRWAGDLTETPIRLAYLLDHQYTARALAWSHLKGTDLDRATRMQAAAARLGGEAVLALTDVHETWNAQVERWSDGGRDDWRDEDDDSTLVAEEEFEPEPHDLIDSDFVITHWLEPDASRARATSLVLDRAEVCWTTPSTALTPYNAEYEGYMGNYGNTIDRWYHRAAVVVWPNALAFANRAEASPGWALGELEHRLAEGVDVANDVASVATIWRATVQQAPARDELLARALGVGALVDAASAALLLEPFSLADLRPDNSASVVDLAVRRGDPWVGRLLSTWHTQVRGSLITGGPTGWLDALPELAERLSARPAVAEAALEGLVRDLEALVAATLEKPATPSRQKSLRELGQATSSLLEACVMAQAAALRDRVITSCRAPADGTPILVSLVLAAQDLPDAVRLGGHLDELAEDAATRLRDVLSAPPRSPGDWSMRTRLGCPCELCGHLTAFLEDPDLQAMEWPLAQAKRQHVHHRIGAAELPVTHTTRRTGRPFTLVLTKTAELFERESRARRDVERDLAKITSGAARLG